MKICTIDIYRMATCVSVCDAAIYLFEVRSARKLANANEWTNKVAESRALHVASKWRHINPYVNDT